MSTAFYIPPVNLMGEGCLEQAIEFIQGLGFKQGLVVTDQVLNEIGLVKQFTDMLNAKDIATWCLTRRKLTQQSAMLMMV